MAISPYLNQWPPGPTEGTLAFTIYGYKPVEAVKAGTRSHWANAIDRIEVLTNLSGTPITTYYAKINAEQKNYAVKALCRLFKHYSVINQNFYKGQVNAGQGSDSISFTYHDPKASDPEFYSLLQLSGLYNPTRTVGLGTQSNQLNLNPFGNLVKDIYLIHPLTKWGALLNFPMAANITGSGGIKVTKTLDTNNNSGWHIDISGHGGGGGGISLDQIKASDGLTATIDSKAQTTTISGLAIKTAVDTAGQDIIKLRADLSADERKLATLTQDVNNNQTNIALNTARATNNKTDIRNLRTEVQHNAGNIVILIGNQENFRREITDNETAIKGNKLAIAGNKTEIDKLKASFGPVTSILQQLQTDVRTNTTNIQTNASNISSLTTNVSALKTDIDNNVRPQLAKNKTDIANNTAVIAGNTTKINTNKANITAVNALATHNQSEIGEVINKAGINTKNIASNKTAIAAVKTEADQNKVEIDKLKTAQGRMHTGTLNSNAWVTNQMKPYQVMCFMQAAESYITQYNSPYVEIVLQQVTDNLVSETANTTVFIKIKLSDGRFHSLVRGDIINNHTDCELGVIGQIDQTSGIKKLVDTQIAVNLQYFKKVRPYILTIAIANQYQTATGDGTKMQFTSGFINYQIPVGAPTPPSAMSKKEIAEVLQYRRENKI